MILLQISLSLWMFVYLSFGYSRFLSDWEEHLQGCGGLNATELLFSSGNYPENYENNEKTCWFFTASAGQINRLRCDDVCTERHDHLDAFDSRYSWGNNIFQSEGCAKMYDVTGKTNEMYIRWNSDVWDTRRGFECYYEAVTLHDCELRNPCNPPAKPDRYIYAHDDESRYVECALNDDGNRTCELRSCPGGSYSHYDFRYRDCGERRIQVYRLRTSCEAFNVGELTFGSPADNNYHNAEICWLFTARPNQVGRLRCDILCIKYSINYLYVHDGPYQTHASRLGGYDKLSDCVTTIDAEGTATYMNVQVTNTRSYNIPSFSCKYESIIPGLEDHLQGCGGLNATEYTFTSGNYPANYDINEQACWFFTSSANQISRLRCDDFCTEHQDILYAYDGRAAWGYNILVRSGGCDEDIDITAIGHEIYVTWSSDLIYTDRGFDCYYEAVNLHDCELRNPCNPLARPGRYIYAHEDESRYVECALNGDGGRTCELRSCPDVSYRHYDFRYRDCGERRLEIRFDRLRTTCEAFNVSEFTLTSGNYPNNYEDRCWLFTAPENQVGRLRGDCTGNGALFVQDGPYKTYASRFGGYYGFTPCYSTFDVEGTDTYMYVHWSYRYPRTNSGFSFKYETICAPGYFGPNGKYPCTACGIGTYAGNVGASSCTVCPSNGTTTLTTGATSTEQCVGVMITKDDVKKLRIALIL